MQALLALPALCLLAVASAESSPESAGTPDVAPPPAAVSAAGPVVGGGHIGPGPLLSALVGTDPVQAVEPNADAGISRPKRTYCKKCGYGGYGGGGYGGGAYVIPVVVTVKKQPSYGYGYHPQGGYCNTCGGGGGGYPSYGGSFSQSSSSSQSSSYSWGRRK